MQKELENLGTSDEPKDLIESMQLIEPIHAAASGPNNPGHRRESGFDGRPGKPLDADLRQ